MLLVLFSFRKSLKQVEKHCQISIQLTQKRCVEHNSCTLYDQSDPRELFYFMLFKKYWTYHSEKDYTFLSYFPLLTPLQIFSRHFSQCLSGVHLYWEGCKNPFLPREYLIYSNCFCLVSCFIPFLFVSCLCQFFILHSAIIWYCALLILQVLFNLLSLVDCKIF